MVDITTAVVEDQDLIRFAVEGVLNPAEGIKFAGCFTDVGTLVDAVPHLDVLLLGDTPTGENRLNTIAQLLEQRPDLRIIILGQQWTSENIQAALDCGAIGIVDKTEVLTDLLVAGVRHVARGELYLSPRVALSYVKPDNNSGFDEREIRVIQLMSQGLSPKEIAKEIGTTRRTVYRIQDKLCIKLNVRTTAQIVMEASKRGLIRE